VSSFFFLSKKDKNLQPKLQSSPTEWPKSGRVNSKWDKLERQKRNWVAARRKALGVTSRVCLLFSLLANGHNWRHLLMLASQLTLLSSPLLFALLSNSFLHLLPGRMLASSSSPKAAWSSALNVSLARLSATVARSVFSSFFPLLSPFCFEAKIQTNIYQRASLSNYYPLSVSTRLGTHKVYPLDNDLNNSGWNQWTWGWIQSARFWLDYHLRLIRMQSTKFEDALKTILSHSHLLHWSSFPKEEQEERAFPAHLPLLTGH